MNRIFLILILFSLFSCKAQKGINIGSKIEQNMKSNSKILIPSGALVNSVSYLQNNSSFTLGVKDDNTVVYISTVDPNFEIEGFKINDDISKIYESSKVKYVIGWGYYIKINSDWYAAFDINSKPSINSADSSYKCNLTCCF
jgi:hypothetical protein